MLDVPDVYRDIFAIYMNLPIYFNTSMYLSAHTCWIVLTYLLLLGFEDQISTSYHGYCQLFFRFFHTWKRMSPNGNVIGNYLNLSWYNNVILRNYRANMY